MDGRILNQPRSSYENLYPKADIFFELGVVGTILKEAANGDAHSIDTTRGILAIFTVPPELLRLPDTDSVEAFARMGVESLQEYFKSINEDFPVSFEMLKQNKGFGLFAKRAYKMRANGDIQWFNYPDPLFSNSLSHSEITQVDMDTTCLVTMHAGRPAIRWCLPMPQNYWQCENPDKLIYTALVLIEELLHISQLRSNGVYIHTFGTEFNWYEGELTVQETEALRNCIERLIESDVTNIIIKAMPFVLQASFRWYHDRLKSPPSEKHFPLTIDQMFLIGHFYASLTNQAGEFILRSFESLPPYLVSPHKEYDRFFSNQAILSLFREYIRFLGINLRREEVTSLLQREFKGVGVIELFLRHCAEFKTQYGTDWKSYLDKPAHNKQNPNGATALNEIVNIFTSQPEVLRDMISKYTDHKPISHVVKDAESLVDLLSSLL